jgi:hypothetical protein
MDGVFLTDLLAARWLAALLISVKRPKPRLLVETAVLRFVY